MPIKKATKPGAQDANKEFTWDNFCKDCCDGKYVLVIGSDAILSKDENPSACGDSTKLLFQSTKDYIKEKYQIEDASVNFNQLSQHVNHLHEKVSETIDGLDYSSCFDTEIDPNLYRLLSTRCFRIVLTTTIDPYLEIAMEKVWGKDGYRVLDIYGDPKDIPEEEILNDEFNELKPTLYYVFGKADAKNRLKKFVLSENDAMSVIASWFSDGKPKELLRYIYSAGKKVMSVGCKFDDWLFRFFWFILRGDVNNLSNGQVAVEFTEEDRKLRTYLAEQKIEVFKDARGFMKDAAEKLENAINVKNLPRKTGGIFISYAHEDKYIALPLFNRLVSAGYDVWLDENLHGSDDYDKRISNAINSCKIFMPILSTQVKKDLIEDNNSDRYYRTTEWKIAQTKKTEQDNLNPDASGNMKVLPIVIGEYDERADYHQKTESCIVGVTVCHLASETFEMLKGKISKLL